MIDKTRLIVYEAEQHLKKQTVTVAEKHRKESLKLFQRLFKKGA
jgi:hypothetical protein